MKSEALLAWGRAFAFVCCLAFSSASLAQVKISIASLIVNSSYLPLWVAQEEGIFAKHGIEADIKILPSAHTHIGGEIPFGVVGVPAALIVVAEGKQMKVLMPVDLPRLTVQFIARPEIKAPADLRGKRIGMSSVGTGAWIGAQLALDHFSLDAVRDGISFVGVGNSASNLAEALESGRVRIENEGEDDERLVFVEGAPT